MKRYQFGADYFTQKTVIGEKGELMVEFENDIKASELSLDLSKNFDDQILIAP